VSRVLASSALERGIKLYKCFIDLTKAYDRVDRDTLWLILERYGVPPKLLNLVKNLHVGAKAKVRIKSDSGDDIFSDQFELLRGLKQGSVFAPLLFNIFFGAIIRAFRSECEKSDTFVGVNFGYDFSKNIVKCFSADVNTSFVHLMEILFADDCELFAESEQALSIMVKVFDRVACSFAQELSIKKTKIMVVERISGLQRERSMPIIELRNEKLEVVDSFTYLGSRETNDGDIAMEINIRKQRMISSFNVWAPRILLNRNISERLRLVFFTMIVVPNGMYGCSSWNLSAANIKELDKTQFQLLKKLLGVQSLRNISYENVLWRCKNAGCKIVPMECKLLKLQLRYIGHILRMKDTRLQKIVVHGSMISGKRKQGAPPRSFRHAAQYAIENFDLLHEDLKVVAADRDAWRLRVNKVGSDFFMQRWLDRRAEERAIRHALTAKTAAVHSINVRVARAASISRHKHRARKILRQHQTIVASNTMVI
jgi:hypothetical protein